MGDLDSDQMIKVSDDSNLNVNDKDKYSLNNNQNIFIQKSEKRDSSSIWKMAISGNSDPNILKKSEMIPDESFEKFSIQKPNSNLSESSVLKTISRNFQNMGSPQWDLNGNGIQSITNKSYSVQKYELESTNKTPKKSDSDLEEVGDFSEKSKKKLCQFKLNRSSGLKKKVKERCTREETKGECICSSCMTDEDYLIREMRFKSYLNRIKITPEIFESIRKIRFCFDCYQPVLKDIDKNQYVNMNSIEMSSENEEVDEEERIYTTKNYEESIILSQNSDKIVSESNSEEGFKIKLSNNVDKTGRIMDKEKSLEQLHIKTKNNWIQFEELNEDYEDLLNQKTLKSTRKRNGSFASYIQPNEQNLDNVKTVKRQDFAQIKRGQTDATQPLIKEMKLSEDSNQIEKIREEADKFLLMDDLKEENENWINLETPLNMEIKSLKEISINEEQKTSEGSEFDILKGYLNQIKIENLEK